MIYVKEKISCTARAFAFFLYARWGHSEKSLMPVDVVYNQATYLWEMDIHNYKARLERSIRRVQTSYEISEENKEVILKGMSENQFLEEKTLMQQYEEVLAKEELF